MDNTVFERNYEKPQEEMEFCTAVFEQAVEGGFFQRYCDMVDKVPKSVNPQDKENYEYLVNRCTVTWWIKSLKVSTHRIRKTTNTW